MTDVTGIDEFVGGISAAHVEPSGLDLDADPEAGDEFITNTHGQRFDPEIHVTDAAGNPKLTKHGKFRLRPGKSGTGKSNFVDPRADRESREQLTLAAETAATLYIQSGVLLFGHEWLPDADKMEREQLVAAFEAYFEAKGITDIPPGVALTIALFGYAAPRLYMPETQGRIARAVTWFKLKLGWMKFNASRIDSRADRLRQDNASQNGGESGKGWWRTRLSARS